MFIRLKQIAYKVVRPLIQSEIDKLNHRLAPERILENRYVTAKRFMPLEGREGFYVTLKQDKPAISVSSRDLPVPPRELWEGYGRTPEEYLALGQEHVDKMVSILGAAGKAPATFRRVLDFGCAAGRMLRFLPEYMVHAELWGIDAKAETISWCQQYLNPPCLFAANTTYPSLPFEDNYFDLIYAGSVFTHIADLADAWFLELRRVLRRGGCAYVTILDKNAIKHLFDDFETGKYPELQWFVEMLRRFNNKTNVLSKDYGCFSVEGGSWGGFPVPQVSYDINYLVQKWSPFAKVVSINERAYGFQTAILFEK